MKQAVLNFFATMDHEETVGFLMIIKEYVSRYNKLQEMYLKESRSAVANPSLLRDLAIQRNTALNHLLEELRQISGIAVPSNARPWQYNVSVQCLFISQLFQVLSDSDVKHYVTAA